MRRALLITGSFFLLLSCKKKDSVPGYVLSKEKMEAVLRDMMRADQFLMDYVFSRDTALDKKNKSIELYRQVLTLHQVTKEKFQESFSFYQSHPELLKPILDSIGADRQMRQLDTISAGTARLPDSTTIAGKQLPSTDTAAKKKDRKPLLVQ